MATKYQGKYYRSRLYMGVDDVGRAKNKDFYSKISQKDADEKRDRYKESLGIGANTNTLKMRFCDVSEDWLEYKKHQLTKKDKKYIGKSQIQNFQCYLKQINKFIGNDNC